MIEKFREHLNGKGIIGIFQDILVPVNGGKSIVLPSDHNIIVIDANVAIAGVLGGYWTNGDFWWAVGTGQSYWDAGLPDENANVNRHILENEIARKQASARYLDPETESISGVPTRVLEIRTIFENDEGNGDLREFSIFTGDADSTPNSGVALNWKAHMKLTKTIDYNLERRLQLWFNINYDLIPV